MRKSLVFLILSPFLIFPISNLMTGETQGSDGTVGVATCKACHAEHYESYAASIHAKKAIPKSPANKDAYYERDNRSDQVTTTDGTTTLINLLYGYKKNRAGAELGFRLPSNVYLSGAYTYTPANREREDIPGNDDDLYSIGLRWSGLSFMMARLGYERLNRRADFGGQNLGGAEPWIRRFDAATQTRNTVKAIIDFFPLENLNFSLGYRYRHSDYEDTVLGFTDTKGHEFNFDVGYLILRSARRVSERFVQVLEEERRKKTRSNGTVRKKEVMGCPFPFRDRASLDFGWVRHGEMGIRRQGGADRYPPRVRTGFVFLRATRAGSLRKSLGLHRPARKNGDCPPL